MGRRIEKKVYSWVSSAWLLDTTEKYVWNGYNIIAIYNASDVLQKSMLYGLDINGGLQTAGGVGGLLFVNDVINTKTYLPVYDGNGNVRVYIDSSDGSNVAEYDYNPATDFTIKTGTKADELAAIGSFSTMPFESNIKMFLWPMRIGKGRFISRDPKDEIGFRLLTGIKKDSDYEPEYVLTQNDTINSWDYLGLKSCACTVELYIGHSDYHQFTNFVAEEHKGDPTYKVGVFACYSAKLKLNIPEINRLSDKEFTWYSEKVVGVWWRGKTVGKGKSKTYEYSARGTRREGNKAVEEAIAATDKLCNSNLCKLEDKNPKLIINIQDANSGDKLNPKPIRWFWYKDENVTTYSYDCKTKKFKKIVAQNK